MAHYTDERLLSLDDLKRLRDKYNSAGEFTDRGFMNELFHGLDGIIDNLEQSMLECQRLRRELDDRNGVIR
jgi:hypothetical protein